jgi:hypothetical protein
MIVIRRTEMILTIGSLWPAAYKSRQTADARLHLFPDLPRVFPSSEGKQ